MIKNDTQLRITREQLEKFKVTYAELILAGPQDKHPVLYKAERESLLSIIEELQEDIDMYDPEAYALNKARLVAVLQEANEHEQKKALYEGAHTLEFFYDHKANIEKMLDKLKSRIAGYQARHPEAP